MRVTHLDHVTVLITDVERSRRFYTGILGLREVPSPATFDFVALWFDLGGQYLHLLLKPQPDAVSSRHFCLHVADAAAARVHCLERGLRIEETVRIPNADRFFIRDPDGNRVELLQWSGPYDPAAVQ